MVDGVPGGRSTHGVCYGALSWRIEDGHAGGVNLTGLLTAIVMRYDDDEPGSPWLMRLHVDERGSELQGEALAAIFLGREGGPHVSTLPWVRKFSELLDVRVSRIELEPEGRGHSLRVGESIELRAPRAVEPQGSVSCIVPGYERVGTELYADEFRVRDAPFEWELSGSCAFAAPFEYASD